MNQMIFSKIINKLYYLYNKYINLMFKNRYIQKILGFILHIELKNIIYVRFIFGSLILVGEKVTYKIGLYPGSLEREILHREIIAIQYPDIEKIIVPVVIKKIFWINIIKMSTYNKVETTDIFSTVKVLQEPFCKYKVSKKLFLNDFEIINNGLDFLFKEMKNYEIDLFKKYIESLLLKEKEFAPAHGDFHLGNILQKNNECSLLIDLDCFRKLNFIWMDETYFLVEYILNVKYNDKLSWMEFVILILNKDEEALKYIIDNQYINNEILMYEDMFILYYLDRLGQELMYSVDVNKNWNTKFMKESLKFMVNKNA